MEKQQKIGKGKSKSRKKNLLVNKFANLDEEIDDDDSSHNKDFHSLASIEKNLGISLSESKIPNQCNTIDEFFQAMVDYDDPTCKA